MPNRIVITDIYTLILKSGRDPADYLDILKVEEGEVFYFRRAGRVGFYSVAKGHHAVELVNGIRNSVIRICGQGDIVGFGNWFTHQYGERTQIRSLEEGKLHFISKSSYDELAFELPELSHLIVESLCKIVSLKDERIAALENHTVKARVSALLLSLSKKFGVETPQGRLIDLKIDRQTLASLAATSVETFARSLTELEAENCVERRRRKILIKSEMRLAKFLKS